MTDNKVKLVTAPVMNINGFALLFSEVNGENLQIPMKPWFDQALSFSIALMIEDTSKNDTPLPILQFTSSKGSVSIALIIEQNRFCISFNNAKQSHVLSSQASCVRGQWTNIAASLSESGFNLFIDGQLEASAEIDLVTTLSTIDQGHLGWPLLTNMQAGAQINTEPVQTRVTSTSFQVKFLRLWCADIYNRQQANEDQCCNDTNDAEALVAYWRYQAQPYQPAVASITQQDFGASSAAPKWIFNQVKKVIEHCRLPFANAVTAANSCPPTYHLAAPQDPERQRSTTFAVATIPSENAATDESKTVSVIDEDSDTANADENNINNRKTTCIVVNTNDVTHNDNTSAESVTSDVEAEKIETKKTRRRIKVRKRYLN